MHICSKMPLESFCKSMGVKGKFDCPEIFEIKREEDYLDDSREERRIKIREYCVQDVEAMANAVFVFNKKVIELIYKCRGQAYPENWEEPFILSQTAAQMSYKIFTRFLIPANFLPTPLNG